jgi:protein O-mannosyl-transferase
VTEGGGGSLRRGALASPWLRVLLPLGLALVAMVVFLPGLDGAFLDWDDRENFLHNPHYRGLGIAQLRWMLTTSRTGHWIPLTWLTLAVDWRLWGMEPFGYHLTSLILHGAAGALLYLVAVRLLARAQPHASRLAVTLGAAAAALLFAVHPLRAESVAWITERRDLVSGFFYLLTVLCYLVMLERAGGARRLWYGAALAAYVLALLSKSIVISLPLVLLVLDVYPLGRLTAATWRSPEGRRVLLEKAPFLAAALVLTVLTAVSFRSRLSPLDHYGPGARLGMAAYSLMFYVWKTVVPADLSPVYELPWRVSLLDATFLTATIVVVLGLIGLLAARRWWPAGLAVGLVYALGLAPVSGLAHAGPQLVADRYSYLATLGLALLLGGALMAVMRREAAGELRPGLARLVVGTMGAWLVILSMLTVAQVMVWHDDRTLWEHALAIDPECGHCNKAFARYHATSGDAEARLRRMLAADPRDTDARIRVGALLVQQRRFDEAETELRTVLKEAPDSAEALTFLGLALFESGRPAEAVPVLERSISLAPDAALPRFGLGRALQLLGRDKDAEAHMVALERVEPRLAARLKRRW